MDVELGHQIGAVLFDRLHAQAEVVGDVLVRIALGDEFQHLALAVRQRIVDAPGLAGLSSAKPVLWPAFCSPLPWLAAPRP